MPRPDEGGGIVARHAMTQFALTCLLALFGQARAVETDATAQMPRIVVTLAPGGSKPDADPGWIDVTTQITGMDVAAAAPFLMTPVRFAGVAAVDYGPGDVQAVDAQGDIPLKQSLDDPDEGGFLYYRRWTASRPVEGEVTLRYRAPISLVIPRLGSGPPFDLRAQGGGVSGAGSTFLVVPDAGDRPFRIWLRWDLAALPRDSIGVSSFGRGDAEAAGPVNQLLFSYYMAGPIGRFPADGEAAGFAGYWIGETRFDADELLRWSHRAYEAFADYFKDANPPPYTVLLRGNPYQGGGGAALINSFLASYADTLEDSDELRETIAHEILHKWVGTMEGPPGSTSWFSEGMTVHYTRELLRRTGLYSEQEFLDSVNGTVTSYYTNALNDLPNAQIAARFWEDTRVRSLPYSRGSLYFADVDAKLRRQSDGKRSLDDLLEAVRKLRTDGGSITPETWSELVVAELGAPAGRDFDAMLAGSLIVPPEEAFGPGFVRESARLRRFELGFDREALVKVPSIVTGLVDGSEAARAGLQNGDRILEPVALEEVQEDPDKLLDLRIGRDGSELAIRYAPRGEAVDGYRWRRSETADAAAAGGRFETVLRPVRDGGAEVTAIEVESVIRAGLADDSRPLSLSAPIVYAFVPGIADRVENLVASDVAGEIPLLQEDDPADPSGWPYYRHWRTGRGVSFPVTVRYRSLVRPADGRRGPPFCIRATAGGVSGAGSGFLVLPENVTSTTSAVRWDLADLAPGSRAVASFGDGDFELAGPPEELRQGWYMAGPYDRYPDGGDAGGFSASWLGAYPFDARAEMELAGEAYAWLGEFFAYLDPPPRYRVFMRVVNDPEARSTGTALTNSFLHSRGPIKPEDEAGDAPRGTFFHEMIHLWAGAIEGPPARVSWFSEGLTSYYTNLLPMLGGFQTVAEYGEGANEIARNYYTNAARNMSADEIAAIGFREEMTRRLPYQRGALYFADLDAKIRAATQNAENLHSFMRGIFRMREQEGFRFDEDRWIDLVGERLGPSAREEFQDVVINGKTLVPVTDAFGPCFERRPASYTTDAGDKVEGYEWVRVEAIADETCRKY